MAENTGKSPLEIIQQIGSADLGPLKASLGGSKRATFAFVFWISTFTTAYQLAIPVIWACAMLASAAVLCAYVIGQSSIEAATVSTIGDNPAEGTVLSAPQTAVPPVTPAKTPVA
jgi:hypothetical protein